MKNERANEPLSPKTYEPVPCVLCGPSQTQELASVGQFGWPTHVSICPTCGLVYLNPRWTREGYATFYASEYDRYYRFDEGQAAEKESRKARVVWKRLEQIAPGPVRSALDIGCGLGWLLDHLRQQQPGAALYGIEPSDYCADHFVNRIGGQLVARDVDTDWHLEHQGQFDRIVFRHVLEHLLDPVAALRKVRSTLATDGYLYIAVPDMMHPDGPLADFWYRCVHVYYYSAATLRRVAALAGLEPVIIREENSELWGVFRRAPDTETTSAVERSVYREQMAALNSYKRQRRLRSLLRRAAPQNISRVIPASMKGLVPKGLREKFRKLVYRH